MQFICCLFNGELLRGQHRCEGLRLSTNVVQTTEFKQRSSDYEVGIKSPIFQLRSSLTIFVKNEIVKN